MADVYKTGIYDFSEVILMIKHSLYANTILIDGFMPDSDIVVSRGGARWTRNESGDSKATTFVRNPTKSADITFSLNQSTGSLDIMNAICQYADTNKSLSILFETTLVDKSSRTIYFSPQRITGSPESVAFGATENGREFVISCGAIQEKLGGSSKIPQETVNILGAFGIEVDDTWTAVV